MALIQSVNMAYIVPPVLVKQLITVDEQSESKISRFPRVFPPLRTTRTEEKPRELRCSARAEREPRHSSRPGICHVGLRLHESFGFVFFPLFQHPYHFRATLTTSDWITSSNELSIRPPPPRARLPIRFTISYC